MSHNQQKTQLIETDSEMEELVKLSYHYINTVIISIFYVFRKIEDYISMLLLFSLSVLLPVGPGHGHRHRSAWQSVVNKSLGFQLEK